MKQQEPFSLPLYIKAALRILKDFEIVLEGQELADFKALPTKEAVDRRRMKLIKEKLGGGDDD